MPKTAKGAPRAEPNRTPQPKSNSRKPQRPREPGEPKVFASPSSDPRHALIACLPPPCLLPSESLKAFEAFRDGFLDALGPTDALEIFFIGNVVALAWEVQRYRRMRSDLLTALRHTGLDYLVPEGSEEEGDTARDMWVADIRFAEEGFRPAKDRLKRRLANAGITMPQVEAATLLEGLPDVERICRLEDVAQARLHACLDDLERRRARLASRARIALERQLPEPTHGED